MQFLSDFADQALVLPLVAALGVGFLLGGWRRGAVVWFAGIGATFGIVLILKVVFISCGWRLTPLALRTPSGHTAAAAVVYGSFIIMVFRAYLRAGRASLLAPPIAAAAVGASRVALSMHTVPEVVVGGGVGIAGAYAITALSGPMPRLHWVFAILLAVGLLLHGYRTSVEHELRGLVIPGLWPPASCVRAAAPGAIDPGD